MNTNDLLDLLGWIIVISYSTAVSNYFIKVIYRKYISKLGEEHEALKHFYIRTMQLIVNNHKLVGAIALLVLSIHFIVAMSANSILLTGVIAAVFMVAQFILGVICAYFNKGQKTIWIKAHRILSLVLIIAIGVHIMNGLLN